MPPRQGAGVDGLAGWDRIRYGAGELSALMFA